MSTDVVTRLTLKHNREVQRNLAEIENLFVDEWGYDVVPAGKNDLIEVNLSIPEAWLEQLSQSELAGALGFDDQDLLDVDPMDY